MLSELYAKRILNENSTAGRTDLVQKFSADVSEQKTVNKRFLERSPTYASKTSRDYAQAKACDTGVDRRRRTKRTSSEETEICVKISKLCYFAK